MTEQITMEQILEELRGRIGYKVNQSDLAEEIGMTRAYISEVLAGRKPVTQKMLSYLGVKKIVTTSYVKNVA